MIKILNKVGIEGTYLNIVKALYDQSKANIISNSKKLKTFPLRSGTKHRQAPFPLVSNIVMEVPARAIRKGKEISHPNHKGINEN